MDEKRRPGSPANVHQGTFSEGRQTGDYRFNFNLYLAIICWLPYKRPRGAPEMTFGKTMIKALKTFDIDPKHWPAMAANRTNWRHRINKWYLSPKACQYLVSTRINRIETVFPCPPFLLFVLCLLSRSSWNLCSNRSWSNYYFIIIITLPGTFLSP